MSCTTLIQNKFWNQKPVNIVLQTVNSVINAKSKTELVIINTFVYQLNRDFNTTQLLIIIYFTWTYEINMILVELIILYVELYTAN